MCFKYLVWCLQPNLPMLMAAKQLDANDANLLPTVKKKQYSTLYSLSHPKTPEVVKHRRISVPDVYSLPYWRVHQCSVWRDQTITC